MSVLKLLTLPLALVAILVLGTGRFFLEVSEWAWDIVGDMWRGEW